MIWVKNQFRSVWICLRVPQKKYMFPYIPTRFCECRISHWEPKRHLKQPWEGPYICWVKFVGLQRIEFPQSPYLGMNIRNYHLFSEFEAPENPWTHFLCVSCGSSEPIQGAGCLKSGPKLKAARPRKDTAGYSIWPRTWRAHGGFAKLMISK